MFDFNVFFLMSSGASLQRPKTPAPSIGGFVLQLADSAQADKACFLVLLNFDGGFLVFKILQVHWKFCSHFKILIVFWSHYLQTRNLGPTHPKEKYSENDLPKIVVRSLNQGSNVVSMDFHPQQQSVLLGNLPFQFH